MNSGQYIVLGLYEGHMASATIMIDGEVIASAHEERFSKQKMDVGVPVQSARFCMEFAGLQPADIDAVAVVGLTLDPRDHLTKRYATYSVDDFVYENEHYWHPRLIEKSLDVDYFDVMGRDRISEDHYWDITDLDLKAPVSEINQKFNIIRQRAIEEHIGISMDRVQFIPHYMCHHFHAYYSGDIRGEDVIVVHNEAAGDGYNAVISEPTPDGLKMICGNDETDLGRLYKWITLLLGMKPHQHEFKVMGLAPYANSYEHAKAAKIFDPLFKVNADKMLIEYANRPDDLYFYFRDKLKSCRFDGIASALQSMVEQRLCEWIDIVMRNTGKKRVCYAGGVAMNVKANKLIAELDSVENLFVPASPADETTHIGAAYLLTEKHFLAQGRKPEEAIPPLQNIYLGPNLDQRGLGEKLDKLKNDEGLFVEDCVTVSPIADLLAKGKIVARCRGRSELGQRALGNRSILADPGAEGTVDRINSQIKYRDFWMPFCPSIIAEDADSIIINKKNIPAKYMTVSFDVRPDKIRTVAAATHPADGTARPQIVEKEDNPEYHELISCFKDKTGSGCVLNTSFNLHGEPIVETPDDAIHTFLRSELDALWVGDYLVKRNRLGENSSQ
jgi:carbamoyltransferase